jgi:anti-sigma28 factor (negative regulator of flagellin synthesis)
MMIDKVGGIGPNYGPRKTEPSARTEAPAKAGDSVAISAEAARAAETARVARQVMHSEDPERADRLREIKERLARGEYNDVSDEQASKIAESLIGIFFRN